MKSLSKAAYDNLPNILTGVSVVGVAVTSFFSWKAAPEVLQMIDIEEGMKGSRLTWLEKIKVAAPNANVIKATLSGVATAGFMIAATLIGNHRSSVLTTAIAAGECMAQAYQAKAIEILGKDKEKEIREAAYREQMHKDVAKVTDLAGIIRTGNGDELFYEAWTGRLFLSSETAIRKGVNEANSSMFGDLYMSLNEFYGLRDINLPSTESGRYMGWNCDRPISISIDWNDWNEKVYRIIYYNDPPLSGFDKLNG
jgi:hypothetical protein